MGAFTLDSAAFLFVAHPHLLSPVLQVINRAISTFLIKQAGLKRLDVQTGAITLIQRFGSAANLDIHLHCLVFDGVYRIQNGVYFIHSDPRYSIYFYRSLHISL
jgi:hypothetical protein